MLTDEQKRLLAIRDLADDLVRLTRMAHVASRGESSRPASTTFAADAREKAATLNDLVRAFAARHGITW